MKCPRYILFLFLAGTLFLTGCERKVSSQKAPVDTSSLITIGTGAEKSLSCLTGHALAETAKKQLEEVNVRMIVKPAGGSVDILKAALSKKLDLALVSSYDLYQAVKGRGEWENSGRQEGVLALFTLYAESLTLVTTDTAGINRIADLKGKQVGMGLPDSSEYRAAALALTDAGTNIETDLDSKELDAGAGLNLLQAGHLDALFYMAVHPDEDLKAAMRNSHKLRLLSIPMNRKFFLRYPYYIRTTIPAKLYPDAGIINRIETFGIKTMLVASSRVPKETAYAVMEGIFDNVENFIHRHPAYQGLTKKNMTDGMYRMIHRGALYYYMQNGYRLSCCF